MSRISSLRKFGSQGRIVRTTKLTRVFWVKLSMIIQILTVNGTIGITWMLRPEILEYLDVVYVVDVVRAANPEVLYQTTLNIKLRRSTVQPSSVPDKLHYWQA